MSPKTTPSAERARRLNLPCGPCRVTSAVTKVCCSLNAAFRFVSVNYGPGLRQPSEGRQRPYHRSAVKARRGTSALLDEPQLGRFDAGEDALDAARVEPIHAVEEAGEHGPIIGQHGVIPILEQARLLDLNLLAMDAAAIDAAAHHPIHAAVAVVGAVIAILAEGAAEFGDHDHHGVVPGFRPDLLRKAGERTAELAEAVGEIAVG